MEESLRTASSRADRSPAATRGWLDPVREWLDRWVFEQWAADARSLGLFRILFAVYVLVFKINHLRWMAKLPRSFYVPPPGLGTLLRAQPASWLLTLSTFVICLAAVALLAGWHTPTASVVLAGMFVGRDTLVYSLGKVNHDLLVWVVPLALAASGWGRAYSIDSRRPPARERPLRPWTLALLALLVGFLFSTSAFQKIWGGWLTPSSQAAYGYLLSYVDEGGRHLLAPLVARNLTWRPGWEAVDWLTVGLEAIGVLALWQRKTFRLFLAIAVVFHLSILLTLNIPFVENVVAYGAFVSWSGLLDRLLRRRSAGPSRRRPASWPPWAGGVAVCAGAVVWFVLVQHYGTPAAAVARGLGADPDLSPGLAIEAGAAIAVLCWGVARLVSFRRRTAPLAR